MKAHLSFTLALLLCVTPMATPQSNPPDILGRAGLILAGHDGGVTAVAYVDDTILISGGADGMLRAWNRTYDPDIGLRWEQEVGSPIHSLAIPAYAPSILVHNVNRWDAPNSPFGISIRRPEDGVWLGDLRIAGGDCLWNLSDLAFDPLSYLLVNVGSGACMWNVEKGLKTYDQLVIGTPDGGILSEAELAEYKDQIFLDPTALYTWNAEQHPLLVGTSHYDLLALGDEQSLSTTAVAWSPDGIHLAIGVRHRYVDREDTTIRVLRVVRENTADEYINRVSFNLVAVLEPVPVEEPRLFPGWVTSLAWSPDGRFLVGGCSDGNIRIWDVGWKLYDCNRDGVVNHLDSEENCKGIGAGNTYDVNGDGVVNIQDLVLVAASFGTSGENGTDLNGDDIVNIQDLILVAGALGTEAAAPSAGYSDLTVAPTSAEIEQWLAQAQQLSVTDATSLRGILFLERLLLASTPKTTVLLPNYPNPFNPETWIPYQLAEPAEVRVSIYTADGMLVRSLNMGQRPAGIYQSKSDAAYWDGRNSHSELVASGLYFYTLKAGRFSATRKMLIRK